ncbi:unnamed protein product, partial [Rotaria sp. Silwood2]
LQNEYRSRATNPNADDLIQLEIIRKGIRSLLEEKINSNLPCNQEHNIKSLGILAKAHFTYYKFNQNKIQFLDHPTKGRVDTDLEMLEITTDFYKDLYDVKTVDTTIWNELFTGLPILNPIDMVCLERDIGYAKCHDTLKIMPLGRVSGEDGLAIEVWRYLFPIIGEYYVRMLNVAKCNGHFHGGFLNAMLTLLKQEGNSNGSVKDFRLLSLMHIDYKILSKVLSVHLKKF